MRKITFLTALAIALVFGLGVAIAAPPDKLVIKEHSKTKGPVPFDHKAHAGLVKDCKACHHMDAAGKEQKCANCHGEKTEGKKISSKEAFHKQCKDCHTKAKKGPTKCDACHQKK